MVSRNGLTRLAVRGSLHWPLACRTERGWPGLFRQTQAELAPVIQGVPALSTSAVPKIRGACPSCAGLAQRERQRCDADRKGGGVADAPAGGAP